MNTDDAVAKGLQKHKKAWANEKQKYRNRPATVTGICVVFADESLKRGHGAMALLSKQTHNICKGFIKLCKNNGLEDAEIYSVIERVVENWDNLKRCKMTTKNGKPFVLSDRPSLRDFLFCRDAILANLDRFYVQDTPQVYSTGVGESRVKQHGPTQEELDAEFERYNQRE